MNRFSKIPQYVCGEKKKTKAVPDFGKLHEKWQQQLETSKNCHKKPLTMVKHPTPSDIHFLPSV